jgi:hypothetical protein
MHQGPDIITVWIVGFILFLVVRELFGAACWYAGKAWRKWTQGE